MDLQAIVQNQQQELENLRLLVNNLLTRPPSSSPRPKLPHPERFDGSHAMWEVWQPEIEAKLRLDEGIYDTEEAKFFYLYSRLSPRIQDLVAPQIAAARRNGYNHQDLLVQLGRLCEDPNARQNAEDRLVGLHQFEDQTFNAYLLTFERQLYKSEADQWTDAAKIALIRRQLNTKLKKRLRSKDSRDVPNAYSDFVKYLQRLDDGLSPRTTKPYDKKASDDKMDVSAMQVNALGLHQPSPASFVPNNDQSSEADTDSDGNRSASKALFNPTTGKYKLYKG